METKKWLEESFPNESNTILFNGSGLWSFMQDKAIELWKDGICQLPVALKEAGNHLVQAPDVIGDGLKEIYNECAPQTLKEAMDPIVDFCKEYGNLIDSSVDFVSYFAAPNIFVAKSIINFCRYCRQASAEEIGGAFFEMGAKAFIKTHAPFMIGKTWSVAEKSLQLKKHFNKIKKECTKNKEMVQFQKSLSLK